MAENLTHITDKAHSPVTRYNLTPESTAEEFSTSKAYAVGDYCFYEGVLYRCKTDKAAGAWESTKFDAVILGDELNAFDNEVSNLKEDFDTFNYISDNEKFPVSLFGVGDLGNDYVAQSNWKPYRASNAEWLSFNFEITLIADSSHLFQVYKRINGTWTEQGGWLNRINIAYGETFAICIRRTTEDTSSTADVSEMVNAVRVAVSSTKKIISVENEIAEKSVHQNIVENRIFPHELFQSGEISDSAFSGTTRLYRCSTPQKHHYPYDITIKAESGYRFSTHTFASMDASTGTWSGWTTSLTIPANSIVLIMLAKTSEDTSEVSVPSEFVTHYEIGTGFTNRIPAETIVDSEPISEHMGHFYDSDIAESYVFFTDPHLMGTNGTFSKELFNSYINTLEEAVKQTTSQYVICGGDWLNNGDTKEQASVKLGYVDGQMRSRFPEKYYPIVGNHDFNYLGVDDNGNRLTESNWISAEAMHNFWFHDHENNYYSFKCGVSQNYVLDTRQDYDGTNEYDKAQFDWLAAKLIEDDPVHAVLFFHIYRLLGSSSTIPTRILAVGEVISAFNSHSVCTLTSATHGYDKTYDFTGTSGHIDYSMVGHSHSDFVQTLGGVPIIATTNMQSGDVPTFDLVFADYTGGKLYLTRVGTGENRTVNI